VVAVGGVLGVHSAASNQSYSIWFGIRKKGVRESGKGIKGNKGKT